MIGQKLLHYEIIEKLGEGGMGVVYKARDTHLDRFVAIKVLPPGKVADPERKRRFVQEAKAASALNHPNIVTVHDIASDGGTDFIAMEYVAGKTLDQLIPRKGMRLGDALKIAVQVAEAMTTAHGAGIVHRDLKPGNVMVNDAGLVKVLDFGLAKLTEAVSRDTESTATIGVKTEEGTVVGSAPYMSPEQAEGRPADARSDIFSFGAVLYEMITGQRAFRGDSKMSTLSAVIGQEPKPLEGVPYDLEKIVTRCLRKQAARRFQHMDDVKIALQEIKEESDSGRLSGPAPAHAVARPRRLVTVLVLTLVALAAAAAAGWLWWRWSAQQQAEASFREFPFTADPGFEMAGSFSPDGTTIAYMAGPPADRWEAEGLAFSIRVKMIGAESTTLLKPDAAGPAWSPDGRWIAFGKPTTWGSGARTSLCVMPRIGGTERKLAVVNQPFGIARVAAWTPDGKWLVTTDRDNPREPYHLVLVAVESGEKHKLTSPPANVVRDSDATLTPDGKTMVFTRHVAQGVSDLYLLSLDAGYRPAGEPRKLNTNVPQAGAAVWTNDGKEIVFCSGVWHYATMWRIRADGSRPARPLPFGGRGAYFPDIARTGNRLVYTKHVWDTNIWRVELQPSGRPAGAPEKFIQSNHPEYAASWSPDGNLIAFASQRSGASQVWLCDAGGGNPRQLTSLNSNFGMEPQWSPDGAWIAFHADADGNREIYVVGVAGGAPRRLTADPADDSSPRWSADGKWIYFRSNRSGESKVWRVAREGGPAAPAEDSVSEGVDPDGVWRYSTKRAGAGFSIWRERAGGGEANKVLDGVAQTEFAVTRKGIYHTVAGPENLPWKISVAFYEFATGKSVKVADLRPGMSSGRSPAVSPDGRYLLYTQCDVETDDLVLVENFR